MYFTNLIYRITPKYTKDNFVKEYLFCDTEEKWFLTENQADLAVKKYLQKVPEAILTAFQKENWHIIVTNENLEQKYGYDFEIYGVTDREEKTIYIYAHQDAVNYGLGHELGHFLDEYLGFVSEAKEWKELCLKHYQIYGMPIFYFSEPNETEEEYFADCFLLYLNESSILEKCNKDVFEMFKKIFTNIDAIVEIISGNNVKDSSSHRNGEYIW